PITNHVTLTDTERGRFAYVTVGGLNQVKVFSRSDVIGKAGRSGTEPRLVATIPTGDLPHGIWAAPDGERVYVGLENGDAVQVIDAAANAIIATIPIGQLPQALVYVPNAVPAGDGKANLVPLGKLPGSAQLRLVSPGGTAPGPSATVVVNFLGQIDQIQIA